MRRLKHGSWIRPEKRHAIYLRDREVCVWCGAKPDEAELTLDHLFPRFSRWFSHAAPFLITACHGCNTARRQERLRATLARLRLSGALSGALCRLTRRHAALDRAAGAARLSRVRAERDQVRALPPLDDAAPSVVGGVPF